MSDTLEEKEQRATLLEMDDASLECCGGRLSAVGNAKFAEDVVDMTLNSRFADVQMSANFFVTSSGDYLLKYFEFPTRQI